MATKYRLGPAGWTASAGAAAVDLHDANEPVNLAWHLVRIFEGRWRKVKVGLGFKEGSMPSKRLSLSAALSSRMSYNAGNFAP